MNLNKCNLCIRNCNVNRNEGFVGYCNSTNELKVARASLHHWEEPCLSSDFGSGTVFFSNCNLKCVFCQNHEISFSGKGKSISILRLAEIFIELQNQKANNINLVTPTHYVFQIIEAIKLSRKMGLSIPIVYNTNSIDSLETIKALDGYIDIYLPDFKYFDDKYSLKYSKINNYSENALKIIKEMVRQTGVPTFNNDGVMLKGVIVRHLMLPGLLFDSKKVIDCIYSNFKDDVYISIMNQYTPMYKSNEYPEINRTLNQKTYNSLIDYALDLGITKGFIQEEGTASESFVPFFDFYGVLKKE